MIQISFIGILESVLLPVWRLFTHWLSIFASPFEEPEMFWIIIPIWGNWFFAEFFQEKYGTDFGNAISNGAIAIFTGVDWSRYLSGLLSSGVVQFTFGVFMKFFVAFCVLLYGLIIIFLGIRTHGLVHIIGKIRWVTYVLLMFTPIVYLSSASTAIRLNFYTLFAIVVFFPLYYWIIEVFDRITPEPSIYRKKSDK